MYLFIACLYLVACATAKVADVAAVGCGATCTVSAPDIAVFRAIAHGDELPDALKNALTALSQCDPDSPALAAAGLANPYTSGQSPVTHALQCFSVVRWTDEGKFIAFYLGRVRTNGSVGPEEFLMIATHLGERWQFTWPADMGPPNLGRE
jgi:hypothetical protein